MYSSRLYRSLPPGLQELAISGRAWLRMKMREGRPFSRLLRELHATQWFDDSALAEYREEQLRAVLHAAAHCTFYAPTLGQWDSAGDAHEQLCRLQIIDKACIRNSGSKSLLASNARGPLFEGGTSGTTGTPLKLSQDLSAINRENAFIWRQLEWAGLEKGGRRAWLRGDMIVPATQKTPPFWRFSSAERMLMMSSYHLAERHAPAYLAALAEFDPQVIQAYPSSVGFLAAWLEAGNKCYDGKSLRGIVTSSESLGEDVRRMIERRFGCRVFDWYGQFERVAAIGTCEHGRQHIVSDYSFVELLPTDGSLFEIVGTGFNNRAMPLIRYRTGDFVEMEAPSSRCECGRSFPLVRKVLGRQDDVVKLPDGRHIGRLDHIFKGVEGILEAQIRQESIDQVDILLVPGAGFSEEVERRIQKNARERLGEGLSIKVERVSAVPRTKNGKLRGVVCNV